MSTPHATVDKAEGPRVLDVEGGLGRIMGDRPLYLKILRRFLHDHSTTPRQIRMVFAAGD